MSQPVQESPIKRILVAGILILAVLGALIWGHYRAINSWWQVTQLQQKGQETLGTITQREATSSGKRKGYYLTINYSVQKVPYSTRLQVEASTYSSHLSDSTVSIMYLPSRPHIANLPDNIHWIENVIIMGIIDLLLIGSLVVLFVKWKRNPATFSSS